ncbi:PepSY domain-containing protein [Telmatospirillum sp. J64-1]|uniref:PepSY domain-containing protein n=1 Tax=Telmatospirillum sp. J64-1 TaxID=2502183 RepID=UPI00163DE2E4|nr:PepSY domain-containing protein [Telmatospirillum sp. J64-1]
MILSIRSRPILAAGALAFTLAASPALADDPPPANAQPLSQIIQTLEQQIDVAYFEEIEWNDGRWEVEYIGDDGRKREVHVDPTTAQITERN